MDNYTESGCLLESPPTIVAVNPATVETRFKVTSNKNTIFVSHDKLGTHTIQFEPTTQKWMPPTLASFNALSTYKVVGSLAMSLYNVVVQQNPIDWTDKKKGAKLLSFVKSSFMKFSKALGNRVGAECQKILKENLTESDLSFHRRCFSLLGPKKYKLHDLSHCRKVLEDPHIRNDFFKYRYLGISLLQEQPSVFGMDGTTIDTKIVEGNVKNFYHLLNSTNKFYKHWLTNVREYAYIEYPIPLDRYLQTSLERRFFLYLHRCIEYTCITRFDDKQIRKGFHLWKRGFGQRLTLRKKYDIISYLTYIHDYLRNNPSERNLFNITKDAIEWHRLNRFKADPSLLSETKTAIPPFTIKENKHVKRLETVMDIISEGAEMSHCIATYAKDAVEGRIFLYTITYKGSRASLAMYVNGTVQQCKGPYNQENAASKWAISYFTNKDNFIEPTPISPVLS